LRGKARCRLHGGHSTGAKTPEGRARIAAANTKHGCCTPLSKARARYLRNGFRSLRELGEGTVRGMDGQSYFKEILEREAASWGVIVKKW
jgi:hypothetical protein